MKNMKEINLKLRLTLMLTLFSLRLTLMSGRCQSHSYSRKINELIRSSPEEVYFFDLTAAKNISV